MNRIYLLGAALLFTANVSLSQEDGIGAETESSSITITSSADVWASPDEVTVQITISEYVHTDPETQATTAISLEKVKKTLFEKLKVIGVDKSDLEFSSMAEGNNYNNYNYGYVAPSYPNYNSTQKKTLSSTYYLEWSSSESKLQELYETLRFNGLTSVILNCDYSEELKGKIREELIDECIKNGTIDAQLVAKSTGVTLGEIVSFTLDQTYNNQQYYGGVNAYFNNSLLRQKHFCTAKLSFQIMD